MYAYVPYRCNLEDWRTTAKSNDELCLSKTLFDLSSTWSCSYMLYLPTCMLLYFKLLELLICCMVVALLISLVILLEFFCIIYVYILYMLLHTLYALNDQAIAICSMNPCLWQVITCFFYISPYLTLCSNYTSLIRGHDPCPNFQVGGYGSSNLDTPAPLPAIQDFNYRSSGNFRL